MTHIDGAVTAGEMAGEVPAVERCPATAMHFESRRRNTFFERSGCDHELERRPGGIAALNRAILQREQLVGIQLIPGDVINAARKLVGIERGHADEGEDLASVRLEHDHRAVVAEMLEGVLSRLLHCEIDRKLYALAFDRWFFGKRTDFASHAVDDDAACTVLSHQHRVVDLLDARLANDRAHRERAFGDLLFAGLTDVPKQVRAERL